MKPTPSELRSIIDAQDGLLRAEFGDGTNDARVAECLNAKRIQFGNPCPIKTTALGMFLAHPNVCALSKIVDAANAQGDHSPARNTAIMIQLMLASGFEREVDPNDVETALMMTAIQSAGFITSQHVMMFANYCRPILNVSAADVEAARNQG